MHNMAPQQVEFVERFMNRKTAERYRDRYTQGRHARVNQMERAALQCLLSGLGRLKVVADLPSGTGRLGDVLAEFSDRVILADSSPQMLQIAKEDLGAGKYEYLLTNAEKIDLPTNEVDLVFCHRLLNHIPEAECRARIIKEFARISRRYVVISCYPPGVRTRIRRAFRRLIPSRKPCKSNASILEYIDLCSQAGLRVAKRHVLRRFPFTSEFVLFEHAASAPQ